MADRSMNRKYWNHRAWGVERLYYASHRLWSSGWRFISLVIKYLNITVFRCYIDPQASIGPRLDLPHSGFGVVIGSSARVGSDAIILHNVTLGNAQPGLIVIGDRVYIGAGATILGPIKIGNDVKIGAGALVVGEDIPDGATVMAPPGRVVVSTARVRSHAVTRDADLVS